MFSKLSKWFRKDQSSESLNVQEPPEKSAVQSVLDSIEFVKNASEPEWPEWKKQIWLPCLYAALSSASRSDELFCAGRDDHE